MSDNSALDDDSSIEARDLRPGMFLPDGRNLAGQNKDGLWIVFDINDQPETMPWDEAMSQGNLPTIEELQLLWENRDQIPGGLEAIGINTSDSWYWSSTELYNNHVWIQGFSDRSQYGLYKDGNVRVRYVERLSSDAVILKMKHY